MIILNWHPRNRRLVLSVLAVVAVVFVMSATSRERARVSHLEELLREAIAPVQGVTSRMTTGIYGAYDSLTSLGRLKVENVALRARLTELEAAVQQLEEVRGENARLRNLLEFTETGPGRFLAARVVGRNPDNWFSQLILNRGTDHGVRKDMVVVTELGLVGRVISTTNHSATVLLLTDPESGVGALIARSRDAGVLLGRPGTSRRLDLKLFSRDADVRVGDAILTSGLGLAYPKGIPVGFVTDVKKEELGLLKKAEVRPLVDLDRLEEVLIVLEWKGETL